MKKSLSIFNLPKFHKILSLLLNDELNNMTSFIANYISHKSIFLRFIWKNNFPI